MDMSSDFLPDNKVAGFIKALTSLGEVQGPVEGPGGMTVLRHLDKPEDLTLDYRRTRLPPKKYLLQPTETVLRYTATDGYSLATSPTQHVILIGLHPCDLASIDYLDRIFLTPEPDPLYAARRASLTLGGISCEPDEYCFCGAENIKLSPVCDFFMEQAEGGYRLMACSDKGEKLLARAGCPAPRHSCDDICRGRESYAFPEIAPDPAAYNDSTLWEKFGACCLSCGACSAVCPTCFCFSTHEQPVFGDNGAIRYRQWDNCLFKGHGMVAGEINFRTTRQERLHYRFLHKFYGMGPHAGIASCTGCGRCRDSCPVEIDLLEILMEG
jgi:ferredoxin